MVLSKIPIDTRKLLSGALAVGSSPSYEYKNGNKTPNIIGTKYSVILPKLGYEKLYVKVSGEQQLEIGDEAVPVKFEDVVAKLYQIDGRCDITVSASSILAVKENSGAVRPQP